jgi:peptidoglycan/LPS O-acetylase OafA/YrhL
MTKRLFWLNGIAVLGVLLNHAIGWGFTAMFWWTDRYLPVSVPNYDAIGTPMYYLMVVAKQLTPISVPIFLAVSGYFIAFASRGGLNWKMALARLRSILIPYLIWSVVVTGVEIVFGQPFKLGEIAINLLTGNASALFYYVPLICQLYLLSPFLVPLIRSNQWKKVLAVAGLVQLVLVGSNYPSIFGNFSLNIDWFFGNLVFFFVFGIALNFHLDEIQAWLKRMRMFWLIALGVCLGLTLVETEVYFRLGMGDWRGGVETVAATFYALSFLMVFIGSEKIEFKYSNILGKLGQKSYAIYLTHPITMLLASKLIYHLAPAMLSMQWLYLPLLVFLGVAVPVVMMRIIARTPFGKVNRYLFG